MTEPTHSDVWLCRLEGDEGSRLRTASTLFRVDVRGARQILAQLPRLVARDLPAIEARKLAVRLRELGGVAHVCGSGQTPDFEAAAAPAAVVAAPGAAAADADASPRAARAEPAKRIRRPTPARSEADQQAVAAARTAQDAAMANWPDDETPCAWEATKGTPPLVPRPIRHSAARVAWTLVIVLSVVGAGAGAFWMRFGDYVLAVSVAEPHVAPPQRRAPAAQPSGQPAPSRFLLAQELAVVAGGEAFRELAAHVAKALDDEGEPLRIENQLVGVSFEVREHDVQAQLESLYGQTQASSSALLRQLKGSRTGYDRLALVPTADVPSLVRLMGTSGAELETEEIVAWLGALHTARAVRLLGAGEHFVEGRYEIPTPDDAELVGEVFSCPGAPAPASPGKAGLVGALKNIRRGERFACEWAP